MLPAGAAPLLSPLKTLVKEGRQIVRLTGTGSAMAANFNRALAGVGLAMGFFLEGCAIVENEQAISAKSLLIGRSRSEIMACAGIPDETVRNHGTETAFYSAAARYSAGATVLGLKNCNVQFTFEAGVVSAVDYMVEDPGPFAPLEACAEIVSACLR